MADPIMEAIQMGVEVVELRIENKRLRAALEAIHTTIHINVSEALVSSRMTLDQYFRVYKTITVRLGKEDIETWRALNPQESERK